MISTSSTQCWSFLKQIASIKPVNRRHYFFKKSKKKTRFSLPFLIALIQLPQFFMQSSVRSVSKRKACWRKRRKKNCSQNWYNIIAIVDVCRPNHSFKGVINDCNFFAKINLVQNDWGLAHIMLLLSDEFFIVLSNWKTKKKNLV